jgi:tetratricopeptide (TPR) repeat protein
MQYLKNPRGDGKALGNLGNAHLHLGEIQGSTEHFEKALEHFENALYGSAVASDQLGERDEAITRMEKALRIYERIEEPNAERARAKLAEWQSKGQRMRHRPTQGYEGGSSRRARLGQRLAAASVKVRSSR